MLSKQFHNNYPILQKNFCRNLHAAWLVRLNDPIEKNDAQKEC